MNLKDEAWLQNFIDAYSQYYQSKDSRVSHLFLETALACEKEMDEKVVLVVGRNVYVYSIRLWLPKV